MSRFVRFDDQGVLVSPMTHAHLSLLPSTLLVPSGSGGAGQSVGLPAKSRESRLFNELAARYLDTVYRKALRLTGRQQDAEDLVQETYLRAWRSLHSYKPGTNAKAWLFRILRNLHIDRFRASARSVETAGEVEGHEAKVAVHETPESLVMARFLDAEVRQALLEIPEVFRTCLILADLEGASYPEIMNRLGIPRGTVMSRLFRGRQAMRRLLTAYGRDHGYLKAS